MEKKIDTRTRVISLLCTLFMVFTLFVFFYAAVAKYIIVNPSFWRNGLFNDDVIDILFEEGDLDGSSLDRVRCLRNIDDDARKEINIIVLDEVFECMEDRDREIDEERLDEFFEEYIEGDLKHDGLSKSEINSNREELSEEITREIEEYYNDMSEREFFDVLDSARRVTDIFFFSSLAATVILIVILFVVHKNKYRPISSIGASVFASGVLVSGLCILIKSILSDSTADNATERAHMGSIDGTLAVIIGVSVGLTVLGIAMIVLGNKAVRAYEQNVDDGYEGDSYRGNDYE
ncbi:MAG: hypothetical protein K6A80_02770 [Saccharofermentans sp.]|nr:hypothetical protein [Saccharofermentans sp.]